MFQLVEIPLSFPKTWINPNHIVAVKERNDQYVTIILVNGQKTSILKRDWNKIFMDKKDAMP